MPAGVYLEGLREAIADLQKLGTQTSDLKDAFKRIGDIAADQIRDFAPMRTGALRGSIRASKTKNKAVVRAGSRKVNYAQYQDRGYKGIPGLQFMRRGVLSKQPEIISTLEDEIKRYDPQT